MWTVLMVVAAVAAVWAGWRLMWLVVQAVQIASDPVLYRMFLENNPEAKAAAKRKGIDQW